MSHISENHFLEELKANLISRDGIKARTVLTYLKKMSTEIQYQVLEELDQNNDDFSVHLLVFLLEKIPGLDISNQEITDVLLQKIIRKPSVLLDLLANPEINDKTPFVEIAGDIQIEEAVPYLITALQDSTDRTLLIAIIKALSSIGHSSAIEPIAEFLYSNDKVLIETAITGLAEIPSPLPVKRLSERIGSDQSLNGKIIEALATMQDELALEKICQMLYSLDANIRKYSKTQLIKTGSKAVPVLTKNLVHSDPDFLIHTLNVLGEIGDLNAVQPIRELLFNEPPDPNVRFAAYEALGMMPNKKGAYVLAQGLSDPEKHVCIAAAKAIEKNQNKILAAGVTNLIKDGDEQAKKIVSAIIDSESIKMFNRLIDSEPFQELALKYLTKEAHPDIKQRFQDNLQQQGNHHLLQKLSENGDFMQQENTATIYVVDDSKIILQVYKSNLHQLGYSNPQFFACPVIAGDNIFRSKPDLLITDLNMPKMTGIELTQKVREKFSKAELPILMVTTQNDFHNKQAADNAGINAILYKPFTKEQLDKEIRQLLSCITEKTEALQC